MHCFYWQKQNDPTLLISSIFSSENWVVALQEVNLKQGERKKNKFAVVAKQKLREK